MSYAKLYEAVQALAVEATTCPACGTNLDTVTEDPFIRARTGLEALAQLAQIQLREQTLRAELNESLQLLLEEMRRTLTAALVYFNMLHRAGQKKT